MSTKFVLAPMAELSHRPLRELIGNFKPQNGLSRGEPADFSVRTLAIARSVGVPGADEYFTEMISAGALFAGGPFEAWYIDNGPCPEKLVYQLVGGKEDSLVKAASLLDEKDCLGIDINMGCSAPAIIRTGAGIRWMEDIDRAAALMAKIRKVVKKRLSIKLRTGITDDFEYLLKFCRRMEDEGVEFITLHPRTSKEKFRRLCRWEYVSRLGKALKIPLGGNGDIGSAEEMLQKSHDCSAIMVGRAAIRQPWIFAQAKSLEAGEPFPKPSLSVIEETGLQFLDLLAKYQPPEFHLSRARRFFGFFCDNLKWGNYLKTLINRETSLSGIGQVWKQYFQTNEE